MVRPKSKTSQACPLINNCPADIPTRVANLGWRVIYTILTYAVLGLGINPGTGFFVSLTLFAIPLLIEYLKFIPDTFWRRLIRKTGIIFSLYCVFIGVLGLIGIFNIEIVNDKLLLVVAKNYIVAQGQFCGLDSIWYSVGFSIPLTLIDWIIYEGYYEQEAVRKASA